LALCEASDRLVVVAGAWERHGVVAYDGMTGEQLWQRRDFKQVQRLSPVADGSRVAVGMARNSTHVVDATTGLTSMRVRAVDDLWQSPGQGIALAGAYQHASLYNSESWRRIWSAPIAGFAILDAAFSSDSVAVADAGQPAHVYWFGVDGTELSRYELGEHLLCWSIAWDDVEHEWVGLTVDVERTGPDQIFRWSASGVLMSVIPLESPVVACAFLVGGQWLITDRAIVDARTGASPEYRSGS
jgi:hypothetical protein